MLPCDYQKNGDLVKHKIFYPMKIEDVRLTTHQYD